MESIFEIIGELLTTTCITKDLKYAGFALILIGGVFAYLYYTNQI